MTVQQVQLYRYGEPTSDAVEGDLWWSTTEGTFLFGMMMEIRTMVDALSAFVDIDYTQIEDYIDQSVPIMVKDFT